MSPCGIRDCTRPRAKRRYCNAHHLRLTRHGDPVGSARGSQARTDGRCVIRDCDDAARSATPYCPAHAALLARDGDPLAVPPRNAGRVCTVDGCTVAAHCRGLCGAHYQRMRRFGDPRGGGPAQPHRRTTAPCHIRDCTRPVRSRGYCNAHALRLRRHGDPLARHTPTGTACGMRGCALPRAGGAYCATHARWRDAGDPARDPETDPTRCSVEGCARPRSPRNPMCSSHLGRAKRYGDPHTDPVAARARCSVEGCSRRARAEGLCGHHAARAAAGLPLRVVQQGDMDCRIAGCLHAAVARGYCRRHWRRLRPGTAEHARPTCAVMGCGVRPRAGAHCAGHAAQLRVHGRVLPERACHTEGCAIPATTRGLCPRHSQRAERPTPAPRHEPPPPCDSAGCGRRAVIGGYCARHYRTSRMRPHAPIDARVWCTSPEATRTRGSDGYVRVRLHGQVRLEHTLIMEAALGRPLPPEATVHHRNGVRDDNRLANLELWYRHHLPGARVDDLCAWVHALVPERVAVALDGVEPHATPETDTTGIWAVVRSRVDHRPDGTPRAYTDVYGYRKVRSAGRWRSEHRLVMEAMLGRALRRGETVHHINGERADNRPANLELWSRAHPPGQRVDDLIAWLARHHTAALVAARIAQGTQARDVERHSG